MLDQKRPSVCPGDNPVLWRMPTCLRQVTDSAFSTALGAHAMDCYAAVGADWFTLSNGRIALQADVER